MGLFLSQERMWDMPLTAEGQGKRIPHWFGNLAYAVVGLLFKVAFRYRIENRSALRAFKGAGGVLLVSNHTSYLDVVMMYLACRPSQWVRLMGREKLFEQAGGLLGQALSRVGAFPVKRDSADRTSVKRAVRMLKAGEVVGILPEGTRRNKGNKQPDIHAGAALVARMGHAPILPMCVRNAENIKQKDKVFLRFPQLSVTFGEPLLPGDFDFLPKDDRLEGCAWYAMREVFALHDRCAPEEVDMAALFPRNRDFTAEFAEHPLPAHTAAEVAAALKGRAEAKAGRAGGSDEAAA